jgi:hypothetical protein
VIAQSKEEFWHHNFDERYVDGVSENPPDLVSSFPTRLIFAANVEDLEHSFKTLRLPVRSHAVLFLRPDLCNSTF